MGFFPLSKRVVYDVILRFDVLNCPSDFLVPGGLLAAICLESRRNNYAIYN